jgi:hypothetical protein
MADTAATDDTFSHGEFRIGQVLSRAFDVFFKHIATFTLIATVVFIPAVFAPSVLLLVVDLSRASPDQIVALTSLSSFVLYLFLAPLATAIILYGAFQHMRGHPVRLGETISRGLARALPLIGLMVVETLGIMLGTLLLIIPGFILAVMWYVAVPICVVERTGPVKSLSRSQELTKGFRWKVFALFLLALIANGVGGNVVGNFLAGAGRELAGVWGQTAVFLVWQGLTQAFSSVLIVVAYYYLRVAKEGMDIEGIAAVFD